MFNAPFCRASENSLGYTRASCGRLTLAADSKIKKPAATHGQSTCPPRRALLGFGAVAQIERMRQEHGAHTMAWLLQEHRPQTMAQSPGPADGRHGPPDVSVSQVRRRFLLASHDARSFLNRPVSMPCCLILRWRVL